MIDIALTCAFSLLLVLTIHDFCQIYFTQRCTNPYILYSSYILYWIFSSCANIFDTPATLNLMVSFLCTFFIVSNYKERILNKLLISISIIAILIGTEVMIPLVASTFLQVDATTLFSHSDFFIYLLFFVRFIPYVCVKLAKLYIQKRGFTFQNNQNLSKTQTFICVSVPVVSIVTLFSFFDYSVIYTPSLHIHFSFMTLIIVCFNIFFFYFFIKMQTLIQQTTDSFALDKQIELYISQYEVLKTHIEELRMFSHDFKHQMIGVFGENEIQIKQINDVFQEVLYTNHIYYTNQHSIDVILNYYAHKSDKENIQLDIQATIYEEIIIDPKSLSVILGNALDNALEASKDCVSPCIRMQIISKNNNVFIEITNPYKTPRILDEHTYLTSKSDSALHGYGLKSIQRCAQQLDGHVHVQDNANTFTLKVLLKNN